MLRFHSFGEKHLMIFIDDDDDDVKWTFDKKPSKETSLLLLMS